MAKKSRDKGKVGEREFAALLRDLGIEARRGVQHSGGPDSPDVVHSLTGFHFEVKRTERLDLWGSLAQAVADAGEDEVPVVAHRPSRRNWVVILDAEEFIAMAADLAEYEEEYGPLDGSRPAHRRTIN